MNVELRNSIVKNNLQVIVFTHWTSVYESCDSIQESIDCLMSEMNDVETDYVLENWDDFTDIVDDSFYHGLCNVDDSTMVFDSMEDSDIETRVNQMELIHMILQHIIDEDMLGLPPHESWEGIHEDSEIVEFGKEKLNLNKKDIIGDYFDKAFSLYELFEYEE